MTQHSSLVTTIAVIALAAVSVGVCCGPLPQVGAVMSASHSDMPMEHGDGHTEHDALTSCCNAHDTSIQSEGPGVFPPAAMDLEYVSQALLLAHDERPLQSHATGEPPGIRDLTSAHCTLLI